MHEDIFLAAWLHYWVISGGSWFKNSEEKWELTFMWIPISTWENLIFEFYIQYLYFPRDKHTQTQITIFFLLLPSLPHKQCGSCTRPALTQPVAWITTFFFPSHVTSGPRTQAPAVTLTGSNNQTSSDTWRGPSRSSSHIWDCWLSVIQTHPCNNLNAVITPRMPMAWLQLKQR